LIRVDPERGLTYPVFKCSVNAVERVNLATPALKDNQNHRPTLQPELFATRKGTFGGLHNDQGLLEHLPVTIEEELW